MRTIAGGADAPAPATVVVLTARDEAATLGATLDALARAFPAAAIVLGDDGSRDATAAIARAHGAVVVSDGRRRGKGRAASRACAQALALAGGDAIYVLCDADLGASAERLDALQEAIAARSGQLAIAVFPRGRGGGLGIALGFARWATRQTTGATLRAPISGQRAMRGEALAAALPFARGFGMELAMTIDALRAGRVVVELELELEHRERGRSIGGFAHRARQLTAFVAVYLARLARRSSLLRL
jgi:glycosyltransferase involved in cell wall biosynthesis